MEWQEAWGRIPDCMLTLFTMTTLSDWSEQVRRASVYPSLEIVMPIFTLLFLAICSLGAAWDLSLRFFEFETVILVPSPLSKGPANKV